MRIQLPNRRRLETGTVSAEAAVVLPTITAFTLGLAWLVSLGVAHTRAIDAAREVARAVARGESTSQGVELGRRVAMSHSRFVVRRGAKTVVVTVTTPVRGPDGMFAFLPTYRIQAQAVAAQEPQW